MHEEVVCLEEQEQVAGMEAQQLRHVGETPGIQESILVVRLDFFLYNGWEREKREGRGGEEEQSINRISQDNKCSTNVRIPRQQM